MTRKQLIALARQVVNREGGQVAAAKVLGVSQAAVGLALNIDPESGKRDATLMRIVSDVGGKKVKRIERFEVG